MNSDDKKQREKVALGAIVSAFGTEEDAYGATLFVSHHLQAIEPEYWEKRLGHRHPKPEEILSLLQLRDHWDDGRIFDFTLPEAVTNYVVSVEFDEGGDVIRIKMES